jgi:hypothetical protein
MSTVATEAKGSPPAYVPFETFENFVSNLNSTLVPDHIDRGMMANLSGGVQSHLMSALRFLGLVSGKDDKVADEFRHFVSTYGTEGWKQALQTLMKQAYSDIPVDITNTTDKKLREAFETAYKLDGSMLDRAVRFYIRGFKESGSTISPHVGKRKPRSPSASKANKVAPANGASLQGGKLETPTDPPLAAQAGVTPKGMIDFPIPMGNMTGFIRVRADLSMEQYPLVEAMLNAVRVLAQTNSGGTN